MSSISGPGPEIWIVLSTHDAGAHLDEQMESIRGQSYSNWRLLMRDDGSRDGTARHVLDYSKSDSRILLHREDSDVRHGACESYSVLIQGALSRGAQWIALADQDDVWTPRKLERQVQALLESSSIAEEPKLLHTDLRVVDENLEPISESFLDYAGLRHVDNEPLRTLIIQNFVTGCTCVFSRGLAARAVPIPPAAVMHDWWLALNAAAWGKLEFLPIPTTNYRQHSANQVGAKQYASSIAALIRRSMGLRKSDIDELVQVVEQARAFQDHLRLATARCPHGPAVETALGLTEDFVSLFGPSVSRLDRVRGLGRLGISRQDLIRDATLKAKLLTTSFPAPRT